MNRREVPTFLRVQSLYLKTLSAKNLNDTGDSVLHLVAKLKIWQEEWDKKHPTSLDIIKKSDNFFNSTVDSFERNGATNIGAVERAFQYISMENPDLEKAGLDELEKFELFLATKMYADLVSKRIAKNNIPPEIFNFIRVWQLRLIR